MSRRKADAESPNPWMPSGKAECWASRSAYGIRFGVVDHRQCPDGETIIALLGFRACIEQFEMQRFTALAQYLSARIVVVETPGYGFADSSLTWQERRRLVRGDFELLAHRIHAAILATVNDLPNQVGVLGYSMGCSLAAAMVKILNEAENAPRASCAVLVEPVAIQRRSIRSLIKANTVESVYIDEYLERTAQASDKFVAPLDRRPGPSRPPTCRILDLALLANALRFDRIGKDLRAATPRLQRLIFVRGAQSALSPNSAHVAVINDLAGHGVAARAVEVPGHHALWLSVPDVLAIAKAVVG